VDLTHIVGINSGVIVALMSGIGSFGIPLESLLNADGFWPGLAGSPCRRIGGGRVLSCRTRKSNNRIAAALRLSAFGLQMGQYCRRMEGRLGKA
jgi:transposase